MVMKVVKDVAIVVMVVMMMMMASRAETMNTSIRNMTCSPTVVQYSRWYACRMSFPTQ